MAKVIPIIARSQNLQKANQTLLDPGTIYDTPNFETGARTHRDVGYAD